MSDHTTWFMIDGKLNPNAIAALYAPGMAEEAIMLLKGTAYEPIAASGPLLARVTRRSELHALWQRNAAPLYFAWQFTSVLPPYDLAAYWRRRLLFNAPMGRTLWLRYADSRVIARCIHQNTFPAGFWQGVSSLQMSAQHQEWSLPETKEPLAWEEPKQDGLRAFFSLNERQLASLSSEETVS
ncbi:DUF4123 domain-containing protein [Halomonas sp. SpR8]|uniref:DUF4123 domain-containing protein n=1 Tax=Halomonas sp. SpR8 TaxID=3050463 RepID=UPI0027E49EBE|nr:DUF4123 domain-containing protein [Halomonas sp. SpR8]MDQ7729775.1 DUF4123 domain-containing protein [Halomonas sp. SpR8]